MAEKTNDQDLRTALDKLEWLRDNLRAWSKSEASAVSRLPFAIAASQADDAIAALTAPPRPDHAGEVEADQAAFEKHYGNGFDLMRDCWSGGYAHDGVDAMWKGWRECWRSLSPAQAPDKAGRNVGLGEIASIIKQAFRHSDQYHHGDEANDAAREIIALIYLKNATLKPPVSPTPDSTGPAGATERESEDAYIARVLAMSSDEIAAEAEAADVEVPEPRSLPASLRNLRFRLEAALANRLEEGDREAIAWLNEGVIAIGAALAALSLTPMPSGITPAGASKLWDAIHEAMVCAWNLLDSTEDDAAGVDQDDWDALSAAMKAMGMLVPKTEQPFSPSYAVPYLRAALTPSAPISALVRTALLAAKQFIANGVEMGFIRMPDPETLDPAKDTPRLIDEALASLAAPVRDDGAREALQKFLAAFEGNGSQLTAEQEEAYSEAAAYLDKLAADRQPETDALWWAVERWRAEVQNRPLRNVHRRSLDTTWRQVIRRFGGLPDVLVGPSHDDLVAGAQEGTR